jgi:hypothetical protein
MCACSLAGTVAGRRHWAVGACFRGLTPTSPYNGIAEGGEELEEQGGGYSAEASDVLAFCMERARISVAGVRM